MSSSVGLRLLVEQRRGRHDLAGLAVAALRHVDLLPRQLQRVGAVGRQPFDRRDGCARRRPRPASDTTRTGLPSMCTVHAPQAPMPQPNLVPLGQHVAKHPEQRHVAGTSTVAGLPLSEKEMAI